MGWLEPNRDPDALPRLYCRLINDCIRSRPDHMAICVHMCRGNFKSAWIAEGGYEPVAEVLLNELDVDGNELSVDDEIAKLRLVVETAREIWPYG